jgi:hypothetical protein
MTVSPMPAPKPALRYQLLPELREMNPGNPILGYLKCFMEQQHFFFGKEAAEQREKWDEMPLKDLPAKGLRDYGGIALLHADYAARLETVDWQVLLKLKAEGFHLLLPEVQQLRGLAQALKIRFRGAVAERRFDDALTNAKTMLALARHLGEHPTLIGHLVALAVAQRAFDPLEEMLQQPDCPNLYWALTDLPTPLIDNRKAVQGERAILNKEVAILDGAVPMSEAQLRQTLAKIHDLLKLVTHPAPSKEVMEKWLGARAADEAHVRAARGRLIEAGLPGEQVKRFPGLQVVLLDEKRAFVEHFDDESKLMTLPYWQIEQLLPAQEPVLAKMLFSFVRQSRVRRSQVRLDQRVALLRHVEALRLYAAEHDGKLPARLADVKVPLPVDPFTGKAFHYQLDGATATLRGSPPRGEEKAPWFNPRYVVTIRK